MIDQEKYLIKNKIGIYQFRRFVPKGLQPYLGKREIRRTLKTRNYRDALIRCRIYAEACERYFQMQRKKFKVDEKFIGDILKLDEQSLFARELYIGRLEIKTPNGVVNLADIQLDPDNLEAEKELFECVVKTAAERAECEHIRTKEGRPQNRTPAGTITFRKLCDRYCENQNASKSWNSSKTETGHRNTFNLFALFFGDRAMHAYSVEEAENFRFRLQQIPAGWLRQRDTKDLDYDTVVKLEKPKLTINAVRDHLIRITEGVPKIWTSP